jgi:hypothetical protein
MKRKKLRTDTAQVTSAKLIAELERLSREGAISTFIKIGVFFFLPRAPPSVVNETSNGQGKQ